MAPRRAKVNKLNYKKLSANDVICPLCRSILIKPITLPCNHGFCSSCFEATTENANVCPLCRVRVGSWLRSAKSKKLINETLWQAIQDLFPLQVKNKLKGVAENQGDKYKENERNSNKKDNSVKANEKLISNLKVSDLLKIDKLNSTINIQNKQPEQLTSLSSTSSNIATKTAGSVTISKKSKQTLIKTDKNDKRFTFINNFATKEYTCRILCQNTNPKDTQKTLFKESQIFMQKKNKRIQEITESEMSNDRSNSIESECLYFKPIDYRHNPPSEGLAPIKVPTRKPNVSPHIKILAPSGQNQINMNYLESAFARLCSAVSEEKIRKNENNQCKVQEDSVASIKRKQDKSENKARKKIKSIPTSNQLTKSKESIEITLTKICDTNQCKNSREPENYNFPIRNPIPKTTNFKKPTNCLITKEHIKRSLQEQADFELATKLQQTFNQSSAYSTRSTVLKRMASKNQVHMEIMTP